MSLSENLKRAMRRTVRKLANSGLLTKMQQLGAAFFCNDHAVEIIRRNPGGESVADEVEAKRAQVEQYLAELLKEEKPMGLSEDNKDELTKLAVFLKGILPKGYSAKRVVDHLLTSEQPEWLAICSDGPEHEAAVKASNAEIRANREETEQLIARILGDCPEGLMSPDEFQNSLKEWATKKESL